MQKTNFIYRIWNAFENSFMTNHKCLSCFKEIPDSTKFMICEDCSKLLEPLSGKLCKKCGEKLNSAGGCINSCEKYSYAFSKNISLYYYTETASRIIKNLKYGNHKYLAKCVAEIMFSQKEKFDDFDILTFVPSSKLRMKERGFNQAEEIAKFIGEILDKPVMPLLVKIKDTIHQAGMTGKDRLVNLKNSFAVNEKYVSDIAGKKILIIDDVFTTGSTLNECAKAIKRFKPKNISCLTFAKTKFNITHSDEIIEIWWFSLKIYERIKNKSKLN